MSFMSEEFKVAKALQPKFDAITALTDAFCQAHLDEEYAFMTRKMCAALSRKRPSPLASGQENIWACAIVQAVGRLNFLGDKSQTPHMKTEEINTIFGVKKSTSSNKATQIIDLLKQGYHTYDYCLPSRLKHHSLAWMVQVNGYILDARSLSYEMQVMLAEAGHIPGVYDDMP